MPSRTANDEGSQPVRRGRGRPRLSSTDGRERAPLDGRRSRDREVIEAAIKLFWEQGYATTSIQDIADELGMLKGSLYYYIDTKENLLSKIFEDSHREVREIAERHRAADVTPLDRLSEFLSEYSLWYLTHRQRASLFAREWRHARGELRELMNSQRKYYDEVLRDFIGQAADQVSPDVDIKLATNFILTAISSLPDWYNPKGRQRPEAVAKEYADQALRLLGAPTT